MIAQEVGYVNNPLTVFEEHTTATPCRRLRAGRGSARGGCGVRGEAPAVHFDISCALCYAGCSPVHAVEVRTNMSKLSTGAVSIIILAGLLNLLQERMPVGRDRGL